MHTLVKFPYCYYELGPDRVILINNNLHVHRNSFKILCTRHSFKLLDLAMSRRGILQSSFITVRYNSKCSLNLILKIEFRNYFKGPCSAEPSVLFYCGRVRAKLDVRRCKSRAGRKHGTKSSEN